MTTIDGAKSYIGRRKLADARRRLAVDAALPNAFELARRWRKLLTHAAPCEPRTFAEDETAATEVERPDR